MRRAQRRRRRGGQFGQTFRRTSIEASPYRARAPRHPGAVAPPVLCEEGNAALPPTDNTQHIGVVVGPGLYVGGLFNGGPAVFLLESFDVFCVPGSDDVIGAGFAGGFLIIVVADESLKRCIQD